MRTCRTPSLDCTLSSSCPSPSCSSQGHILKVLQWVYFCFGLIPRHFVSVSSPPSILHALFAASKFSVLFGQVSWKGSLPGSPLLAAHYISALLPCQTGPIQGHDDSHLAPGFLSPWLCKLPHAFKAISHSCFLKRSLPLCLVTLHCSLHRALLSLCERLSVSFSQSFCLHVCVLMTPVEFRHFSCILNLWILFPTGHLHLDVFMFHQTQWILKWIHLSLPFCSNLLLNLWSHPSQSPGCYLCQPASPHPYLWHLINHWNLLLTVLWMIL